MTDSYRTSIELARSLVPEIESILSVENLQHGIDQIDNNSRLQYRDVALGDVVSVASLVVGLIAFILQVKSGNTLKGSSRDQILERLIERISNIEEIAPTAKVTLINKLIDKCLPNLVNSEDMEKTKNL